MILMDLEFSKVFINIDLKGSVACECIIFFILTLRMSTLSPNWFNHFVSLLLHNIIIQLVYYVEADIKILNYYLKVL